jgi:hypothetical protein
MGILFARLRNLPLKEPKINQTLMQNPLQVVKQSDLKRGGSQGIVAVKTRRFLEHKATPRWTAVWEVI